MIEFKDLGSLKLNAKTAAILAQSFNSCGHCKKTPRFLVRMCIIPRPPLWSSGQSSWLLTQGYRVRFRALPDWVWNGVHSALVRINEELLERKVAAPV
jgi:hypothetical protein